MTIAPEVSALVQYKNTELQAAADEVIQNQLTPLKGSGGIVAVTPDGQLPGVLIRRECIGPA